MCVNELQLGRARFQVKEESSLLINYYSAQSGDGVPELAILHALLSRIMSILGKISPSMCGAFSATASSRRMKRKRRHEYHAC